MLYQVFKAAAKARATAKSGKNSKINFSYRVL